jgi:hypothetical protein
LDHSKIIRFCQEAYVEGKAIWPDSKVVIDSDFASLTTSHLPERWANAVSRAEIFGTQAKAALELARRLKINLGWLAWDHEAKAKLVDSGFVESVPGRVLFYDLTSADFECAKSDRNITMEWLSDNNIDEYLEVKLSGWNVPRARYNLVREGTKNLCNRPEFLRALFRVEGRPAATGGVFIKGEWAYFQGTSVDLKFRGQGVYRRSLDLRFLELRKRGVKFVSGLADMRTSGPILEKCGFKLLTPVSVLAMKESAWVPI